jgi:hypothetical protein
MELLQPYVIVANSAAFQINKSTSLLVQVTNKLTRESRQVQLDRQQSDVVAVTISNFGGEVMLLHALLSSRVVTWVNARDSDCPKNVLKRLRTVQFAQKMLVGRGG